MEKNQNLLFAVLGLGLYSMSALAFDIDEVHKNQTPLAAEFTKMDINSDEKLTRTEIQNDPIFAGKNFAKADTNHDGKLNRDEFTKFKSAEQKKTLDLTVDDSVITTKAKAEILATKGLKSYQISVETYKGNVILSGFVDNQAAIDKAGQVVAKVNGVKSVKNSLQIK